MTFSPLASAGDPKPYETVALIDSALHADSSLQGKVVYVDFWASWCLPCRKSFPWMQGLSAQYGREGFRVVTVGLDREHEAASKFLKDVGGDLTVVYDSTGALAKLFQVEAMPTSFLYARDGSLESRHEGFGPEDTAAVTASITALLRAKESK